MPVYEYYCEQCERELAITLSISQHGAGTIQCPTCGGQRLRQLVSSFFTQTSVKS